jgi:hypothetical protein
MHRSSVEDKSKVDQSNTKQDESSRKLLAVVFVVVAKVVWLWK